MHLLNLFVAELWACRLALVALSVFEVPTIIIDRVTRVSCTLYFLPNSTGGFRSLSFQRERVLCASSTTAHVQLTNGFVSTFGLDLGHTSFPELYLASPEGRPVISNSAVSAL